jgi:hypothetical protein
MDDYERRVKEAGLLIDESWKAFGAQSDLYKSNRDFAEEQRITNEQLDMARGKLGIDRTKAATSARNAATSAKNADIRAKELALKRATEQRQLAKSKAEIRQADANIKLRREELRLAQQKAKGGGSNAQKAERDLAISILKDSEAILGKPGEYADQPRVGAKSYAEARAYVQGLAEALMGSYRTKAYIDKWVKDRLRALGLTPPKRRSGQ